MSHQLPLTVLDGLSLAVLLVNIPDLLTRRKAAKTWKRVSGKIIEFRLNVATPAYWFYTYEFAGTAYRGKDINQLQGFLGTLKTGSEVLLFVNPTNPKQSFIDPPIGYFHKIFFFVCGMLVLLTVLQFISSIG